ncbi:hypothetical protein [Bifidobacterium olomucense]|uniref:Uncharacterized protein n=1 Tax=Bifidobacterium olomucense TaxID=2675324 RepID=A0A7Y0EXC3_9BIFI|nr:hypothetical protein [Bifidobacterium sp. DSM 109959]NMM98122.1 hypothetical protein [Bifidobacterium sp. DSM 109959]
MSRKIRIGWEDMQPGDLIHVKGSNNTYVYKHMMMQCPDYAVVDSEKTKASYFVFGADNPRNITAFHTICRDNFDYATRPAPKKPRLQEPSKPGEYWVQVAYDLGADDGHRLMWAKLIKRARMIAEEWRKEGPWMSVSQNFFPTEWTSWENILEHNHVVQVLSAEEYYTRKAAGEL